MRRKGIRRSGGGFYSPSPEARKAEQESLDLADDLAPLLDAVGIDYRRGDGGRKLTSPCPSPDHSDRSPSWFLNNDPRDTRFGTHACSSCPFRGGIAHLTARAEGGVEDWTEAATLLRALFIGEAGVVDHLLDRKAKIRASRRRREVFNGIDLDALGLVPTPGTKGGRYLSSRGVPEWAQALIGARWAPRGTVYPRPDAKPLRLGGRVVLPVISGGVCETFTARAVDHRLEPRYLHAPVAAERAVWGLNLWTPGGTVAITEGILDGWATRWLVGLPSYAVLRSRLTPTQAARLRLAERVIVIGDGDIAGDKLRADAAARLPSVREVLAVDLPRGFDPADALREEGDPKRLDPDLLRSLVENAYDVRAPEDAEITVRYNV